VYRKIYAGHGLPGRHSIIIMGKRPIVIMGKHLSSSYA
jgi:hypothetical protein